MDTKQASALLEEYHVNNIRMIITDLNGIPLGKRIPSDRFLSICEQGMGMCSGIYNTLSDSSIIPELPLVGGFSSGFPDMVAWPDLKTLRSVPWEERTAMVICDMRNRDGSEVPYDARTVLRKQIEKMKLRPFSARIGMEHEFYVFKESLESMAEKNWVHPRTFFQGQGVYSQIRSFKAGPVMKDAWQSLMDCGIGIDSMQVELGAGMFELPLKASDPLTAADQTVLAKMAIKEICHLHGLTASFMAKIGPEFQGLSGAVHMSLVDVEGKNLFYDPEGPDGLSEILQQWVEGLLENLQDLTLVFLPNYNSYKRPLPNSFVGTTTTWSVEGRGTPLRIINFVPEATRFENRLPGADGNPYLVLAAHLVAGLYGLEKGLKLRPPFTDGDPAQNPYGRDDVKTVPPSLESAIDRFRASARMREFFGDAFCEVFLAHRASDLAYAGMQVATWERERYLETA